MKFLLSYCVLCLFVCASLNAQPLLPAFGDMFEDSEVPRIDIFLPEDSLDALYDNPFSNHEYKADFVYSVGTESDTVNEIGLRPRGNFSRGAEKKSFKVSFNTFKPGRKYQGRDKLNLNGQHNDPTVARSKVSLDLYREMGLAAPRSNHVELWINGNYHGLYINTEHIDEEFTEDHYGSSLGNLYKCTWPADLTWSGTSPSSYAGIAQTQQGDLPAFDKLISFLDVLNNTPDADFECALEEVFDVQEWLSVMATEVLIGHWDGYIYNQNNFYLYEDPISEKVLYIPYDVDNTMGIAWFGDWTTRDIYSWSNGDRPLYDRILSIPRYRDQYSYHINKMLTGPFDPTVLGPKVNALEALVTDAGEADLFRTLDYGYTIDDFHDNFEIGIGGHSPAGINSYNQQRHASALSQLVLNDIDPIINHVRFNYPDLNEAFAVRAFVEDEDLSPTVELVYNTGGTDMVIEMFDDGLSGDGTAGDGVYGTLVAPFATAVSLAFQIRATDNAGNESLYPCEPLSWEVNSPESALYINELMAINTSSVPAPEGNFTDWFEIYNAGTEAVFLGDKFVSDNPNVPSRWRMPDAILGAGEFMLFWADDDENEGPNHTNFRLDGDGGFLGVFDSEANSLRPIHEIYYGVQTADVSIGYLPDASGDFNQELEAPTPGYSNLNTGTESPVAHLPFEVFPNPASGFLYLSGAVPADALWTLTGTDGRAHLLQLRQFALELPSVVSGYYILKAEDRIGVYTIPVFIK